MARVVVRMYATVREAAQVSELQLEASGVREVFRVLRARLGPSFSKIMDRAESDPDSLVILINGKVLGRKEALNSGLSDGDEISLFPPVSGG